MKKMLAMILALVMVVSFMAACGNSGSGNQDAVNNAGSESDAAQLRVGVCLYTKNDEWMSDISDEFEALCAEKGYSVSIQDGTQENEKLVQQIENFIAQEYDVIVLSAYDVEGILPAIDKCQEAGIPVIAIDTAIDHPWVSTCIAWDNYETGKVLGEYAANYIETNLSDKETVNIIMLDGTGYPHLEKRDQGFLESLSRLDNVEIIARQCTNGNRELSANVVSNNLTKGVDLIYGVVDNHAWGAVTALEEAQVENCAVICCGGFGEEPFEALEADHPYYKALIVVPPVNIVTSALDAVEKVLAGETVESTINIEFGLADHDTVGNYR